MPRQPFVHEGEVRADEIQRRAVLADDLCEVQLRLGLHGLGQGDVPAGVDGGGGGGGLHPVDLQPLGGQALDEGPQVTAGLLGRQQPLDLLVDHRRIVQPPLGRQVQQLGVGPAAGDEVGQPRGEGVRAQVGAGGGDQRIGDAAGLVGRLRAQELGPIHEFRRDQHRLQGTGDSRPRTGLADAGVVGVFGDLGRLHRPPERPGQERFHRARHAVGVGGVQVARDQPGGGRGVGQRRVHGFLGGAQVLQHQRLVDADVGAVVETVDQDVVVADLVPQRLLRAQQRVHRVLPLGAVQPVEHRSRAEVAALHRLDTRGGHRRRRRLHAGARVAGIAAGSGSGHRAALAVADRANARRQAQ